MDALIHQMLETSASRSPEAEAIAANGERLTYAETAARVRSLAGGLAAAGIERGDRVGIYLDHGLPLALSIFAVSHAQAVFVPINGLLVPDQVAHIGADCGMTALVTSASRLPALLPVLSAIPSLRCLVLTGAPTPVEAPCAVWRFDDLLRRRAPTPADMSISKDLAGILYTSGSTGRPKGVMLTHAQVMAGSSIVSSYLGITAADRILSILPLSFDAGLNQLMTAWQQGATLVMTTFIFAREIVTALAAERITGLAGVPTLWSLLAERNSGLRDTRLPDLRYVTNTGGRLPQAVLAILRGALPATRIFLMYGLTEAFRSTYLPPEELDRRPTSIGKAIPDTEILVLDEDGRPCKPGQVGELVHRGPTVSLGYWGRPDATAEVLRPHPLRPADRGGEEKVCYSGDLVTTDEDGFIYFVGRRDAMIKSSGYRISPTEVEEVLFQSGVVKEAAVIGVPHDVLGQSIKAFVVPRHGALLEPDRLADFCAARLPRYMVPAVIEVLETLPKTSSGKVDYPSLRRRQESRA